jgi:quercetin dioxygenase-like cupin family protein
MKTITAPALIAALAVVFPLARLAGQSPTDTAHSTEMRLYAPTAVEWKDGPAALPAGAKAALLEGDPTKEGPFVMRLQMPDGYHVPPHTHPKTERVTVISGAFYLATGESLNRSDAKKLPAGSFGFWPAGMKHAAWAEGETVIQLHGSCNFVVNFRALRAMKGSPAAT